MILRLPADVLWCVVKCLPVADILSLRMLSREWCGFLDSVSQEEWKRVYMAQVCDALMVGASFDWKKAAIATSRHVNAVEAVCTWNKKRVRFAVPWCTSGVDPLLRADVTRAYSTPVMTDYVYDGMFLLRGLLRTCRYRPDTVPCRNCQSKQSCLVPTYDYYIRPVSDDTSAKVRDERLGFLLAISPLFLPPEGACDDPSPCVHLE